MLRKVLRSVTPITLQSLFFLLYLATAFLVQLSDNSISVFTAFASAPEITSQVLSLFKDRVAGILDPIRVLVKLEMPQHHDGREE